MLDSYPFSHQFLVIHFIHCIISIFVILKFHKAKSILQIDFPNASKATKKPFDIFLFYVAG